MQSSRIRLAAIVLLTCSVVGCARNGDTIAPEPLIPDTPEGTVLAVAQHLADHDPAILWEALPESYRSDITELTHTFAAKMDPELYDRTMAVARRAVEVLQEKQPIILASSTVASTGADVEEIERGMTGALAAVHALLSSEIATLEGLGAVDWPQFLAGTGTQLMALADVESPGGDPDDVSLEMLRSVSVETVSSANGQAVLRITAGDREPEELKLTRVEGRWVPAELAERWPTQVAESRARLDELTPERIAELKPQAMMALAMAEAFIEQLATMESSQQFDAVVGQMLQSMMGNLAPAPPAEDGDGPASLSGD